MRLAGDHCGHCHNPKPVTRTAPFFGFMILVAVLAVSLSVLSWAIFAFSHAT
ncbi:MAG: hypothetical protein KDA50_04465 [Rhodobacteraceae bacterium]|nr:hypothetical protein [Paracoccaceae bacterium]